MRFILVLAGCFGLFLTSSAHAGLYNTSEPAETFVDPTYLKFHANLLILRSLGMDKVEFDNPMRRRYMLQADLARRGAPGSLSVEQTLNLSTILVRRRQPDEAINLLRPLAAAQSRAHGLPDLPVVTVRHPIGGIAESLVPDKAGPIVEPVAAALTAAPSRAGGTTCLISKIESEKGEDLLGLASPAPPPASAPAK